MIRKEFQNYMHLNDCRTHGLWPPRQLLMTERSPSCLITSTSKGKSWYYGERKIRYRTKERQIARDLSPRGLLSSASRTATRRSWPLQATTLKDWWRVKGGRRRKRKSSRLFHIMQTTTNTFLYPKAFSPFFILCFASGCQLFFLTVARHIVGSIST